MRAASRATGQRPDFSLGIGSAAARGGEAPSRPGGFEVALEGPEIGQLDHGLGAVGRIAAGIQGEVHLIRDEADDDGGLVAEQFGFLDAGGEDALDFGAVAFAGLLARGDGAFECSVDMLREQGLERGAVAGGKGGDDGAEGGFHLVEEFGRVEIGGALDDLHQPRAEGGVGIGHRAAGSDGYGLALDDRALGEGGGGRRGLPFEADAFAEHAA